MYISCIFKKLIWESHDITNPMEMKNTFIAYRPLWEPTSQGSPHLQYATPRRFPSYLLLTLLLYFFSSFTFPGAPYRIFFPFVPRFPCHFYHVVIEQTKTNGFPFQFHNILLIWIMQKYTFVYVYLNISLSLGYQISCYLQKTI